MREGSLKGEREWEYRRGSWRERCCTAVPERGLCEPVSGWVNPGRMNPEYEIELRIAVVEGLLAEKDVYALREEAHRQRQSPLSLLAHRRALSTETLASLMRIAAAMASLGHLKLEGAATLERSPSRDAHPPEVPAFPVPGWERYQGVCFLGQEAWARSSSPRTCACAATWRSSSSTATTKRSWLSRWRWAGPASPTASPPGASSWSAASPRRPTTSRPLPATPPSRGSTTRAPTARRSARLGVEDADAAGLGRQSRPREEAALLLIGPQRLDQRLLSLPESTRTVIACRLQSNNINGGDCVPAGLLYGDFG